MEKTENALNNQSTKFVLPKIVKDILDKIPKKKTNEYYSGMISTLDILINEFEFKDLNNYKSGIKLFKEVIAKYSEFTPKTFSTLENFKLSIVENKIELQSYVIEELSSNINSDVVGTIILNSKFNEEDHVLNIPSINNDSNLNVCNETDDDHLNADSLTRNDKIKKASIKSISNSTDSYNSVNNNLNSYLNKPYECNKIIVAENGTNTDSSYNTLQIQSVNELFYDRFDLDLKCKNELFDREVNLLKSLILINNLHLNTFEKEPSIQNPNQQLFKDNYFVSMTEGKSESIANDKYLYNKIQTLNLITMQISNLGQELKELKSSIEAKRADFKKDMNEAHKKVITAFAQEVKSRKAMRGKIINIEKLI
jgi:hypothetical protein